MNWQGVLNNAYRLRGESIFTDMGLEPGRARHVFECVAATMADGARRVYERQRRSGVEYRHFTASNCLVNMVSPAQYRGLLLPFDRRFGEEFGVIAAPGRRTGAWTRTRRFPTSGTSTWGSSRTWRGRGGCSRMRGGR